MRWASLVFFTWSCVPAATLRGEAALRENRPAEALREFEAALHAEPQDTRSRLGRTKSLNALLQQQLDEVKRSRQRSSFAAALTALRAGDELIRRGAEPGPEVEAERQALLTRVKEWVEEPLALGQPLAAEQRLALVVPVADEQVLNPRDLQRAIQAVGARRCAVLSAVGKTPWLSRFMRTYCEHFRATRPPVLPTPEQRSTIIVRVEPTLAAASSILQEELAKRFRESVWFDADASSGLLVQASGSVESDHERQPMDTFVAWVETETYSTTENVTEYYTENYTTTEQRPYTRYETSSETYTYSCGTGTSYRTCTGSRPVTRSVTAYRSEMVTKTRQASRTVPKTVYKTRPVSRRYDFKATQVSATHASRLEVAWALPGTAAPTTVQVEERVKADDLEHDVDYAPAGLKPHRATVLTDEGFRRRVVESLGQKAKAALESAWEKNFCQVPALPEAAARCVHLTTARHDQAWDALARFIGESSDSLTQTLTLEAR